MSEQGLFYSEVKSCFTLHPQIMIQVKWMDSHLMSTTHLYYDDSISAFQVRWDHNIKYDPKEIHRGLSETQTEPTHSEAPREQKPSHRKHCFCAVLRRPHQIKDLFEDIFNPKQGTNVTMSMEHCTVPGRKEALWKIIRICEKLVCTLFLSLHV